VSVTKGSDELWVAEKFQSNLEIAGSPRNVLRYSRVKCPAGVERCWRAGGASLTKRWQTANTAGQQHE
jgi:hypothetical protein